MGVGKRTGWMFRLLAIVLVLACIIAAYWILVPFVAAAF